MSRPARRRRVGILGGTFDPIHAGHLILAEETRQYLSLDKAVLVPAGHPWRKADREITPAGDRIAMVSLAIAANPAFALSRLEVEREGATYTADTLHELRMQLGGNADLWFILGSDALLDLQYWRDPKRIVAQVRLAVAARGPVSDLDLGGLEDLVPGVREKIDLVPMPPVGISSSELRRRLRHGFTTRYWLPAEVERYALDHNLYGRRRASGLGATGSLGL
ncbi:MAG TPA: nicotinate-nucleotide adenylyltransferase [Dehalococcoidia bacterium]|nr:nicotinate-nucleotide adenylyltransferase [Dehalococcoidia bacterium]